MKYLKLFLVLTPSLTLAFYIALALVNRKYLGEITSLQQEVAVRDSKISFLESQLAVKSRPLPSSSSMVQVSGVSIQQVQKALKEEGIYAGPDDGYANQKTTDAIKQFQKMNGLKADGLVGKRTWALLRAATRNEEKL